MAIPDVHAIPETAEACTEYQTEADQAWNDGNQDHAWDVYRSLFESHVKTDAQESHVGHRLALIAVNRGQTDVAWTYIAYSNEPGAADIKHSLDNATPNDPTPDPEVVPTTVEQTDDWWNAGVAAKNAGDWDLAGRFFSAIAASTCNQPNVIAKAEVLIGDSLHELGDDAAARQWYEKALPNLDDPAAIEIARQRITDIGVKSTADHSSPAAEQVVNGVEAYQLGDAAAARTALEAALHLDGPDDVKGRAHYYLGAMDYQENKYADARSHIEAAANSAPDPEKGWATDMLTWHYDETAGI
jgi:tetratricopeptide (TPR) repeat protein